MANMKVNRTETVGVRLTPAEKEMVRIQAARDGLSESDYVRSCILTVRGIEGDPLVWSQIKENVIEAINEAIVSALPKRKSHA